MDDAKIHEILARLTAPSKSGTPYRDDFARMTWVAADYSKKQLVDDLRSALSGEEEDNGTG